MDRPPAWNMPEARTGNRKFIWSGLIRILSHSISLALALEAVLLV